MFQGGSGEENVGKRLAGWAGDTASILYVVWMALDGLTKLWAKRFLTD